jgi:hypothetical protein
MALLVFLYYSVLGGTRLRSRLRHSSASRKAAGSSPDEVIRFVNCPSPSSRTVDLGVDSASNRNEYEADNLTAICEPIV